MVTENQAEANRENAKASTGPRTDEGKQASAMNAFKHGLTAKKTLLPTEDQKEYDEFRKVQMDDLAPVGALEKQLAGEIVDLNWRLQRASRIEHGILIHGVATINERFFTERRRRFEVTNADVVTFQATGGHGPLDKVVDITRPDLHENLTELVEAAAGVKRTGEGLVAEAFINDAGGPDAMAKVSRHETSLFRRRNQALATLAEAQRARIKADVKETP